MNFQRARKGTFTSLNCNNGNATYQIKSKKRLGKPRCRKISLRVNSRESIEFRHSYRFTYSFRIFQGINLQKYSSRIKFGLVCLNAWHGWSPKTRQLGSHFTSSVHQPGHKLPECRKRDCWMATAYSTPKGPGNFSTTSYISTGFAKWLSCCSDSMRVSNRSCLGDESWRIFPI